MKFIIIGVFLLLISLFVLGFKFGTKSPSRVTEIEIISIIEEKQKCDEAGGEFDAYTYYDIEECESFSCDVKDVLYLGCNVRTNENIFNYKLNLQ